MDLHSVITLSVMLLQQMCVYLAVAYALSRTRLFIPLTRATIRWPHRLACYVIFTAFCIMGTLLGFPVVSGNAIANTPAIGAVLGGLLGGPVVGLAVGITGGIHRYFLGGSFGLAASLDIVMQGLIGGLTHRYLIRRGKTRLLFSPLLAGGLTFVTILLEMGIDLALSRPFDQALHIVYLIVLPELIANSAGAAVFAKILLDRRDSLEQHSRAFSAKALEIAAHVDGVLRDGFDHENSMRVARIIYDQTGVGAVAITDCNKILAFIGIGADHHLPGTPITSPHTLHAIANNEVLFADGNEIPYQCSISPHCKLGSSLVIPLVGEDKQVIGTIKLYEPKTRIFSTINRTLGEGIAKLLSNQILDGRFERQKSLLLQSELKLLHAQVNPHFLFNTLNTIIAVTHDDVDKARGLLTDLAVFLRKNLKRPTEDVQLSDEIEHIDAYLRIQLARFADRLSVEFDLPEPLLRVRVPAFTLQPLVENAIKHGTSQMIRAGVIRISARQNEQGVELVVEDNAGLYDPGSSGGLGMNIVDRRIKTRYGESYGVTMSCERNVVTRATVRIPLEAAS
ncbi:MULTISPECIES: sensor histidine kinase [unclassified Paludibacterium]|uniref:sensor histidine kinase n=1 Tax=unclassified Paludibacterium TaxID=2618429 RepID=UPI001C04CF72|nr:sensor histidine kinase [Paludibacterium sp. B53371]BEV72301.1 sensor histidine kinase [Paludibacterium sp. THUN1379]